MPHDATPREWDARAYHRLSEPQFTWGRRVLEQLELAGSERVLDAGCGTGRLTALLAERLSAGHVVGVDRSVNMAMRAHAELSQRSRVRGLVAADLTALPFSESFDVIFSTATFHWVLDHDALFANLHAALSANGRLHAQCGGGANLAHAHAHVEPVMALPPFAEYFRGWREAWRFAWPEETSARLLAAGFVGVRCWLEETPVTFADKDTYKAFMEAVVLRPHLAQLPDPPTRSAFLDEVAARAGADVSPFTLDYWRLNLRATKPSAARG